jgi:hypothetical protein
MRTALHLLVLSTLLVTPGLVAGAFAQPGAVAGVSPALDELPGFVARETAADYRARARFPESSRPLEAGDADPVRAKRVPAPYSLATPGVEGLLTLWPQETSFPVGEPVELHAAVTGLSRSEIARMEVTGEVVDQEGDVLGTVTYRDDGRGADAVPRDGTFGATFTLPPGMEPDLAASYLVRVTATKPDGEELRAAGGFLVSNPHARLTGALDSRVEDGNLVVSVEIDVDRPGRYHLAATLTTMKGEPVAWAQAAEPLDAGTHKLELAYYGLIFHDLLGERGVAGPFRVASLALSNASGMPNAPAPLVEDAAVIPALPLAKLTRTPFGDPSLLEAAERLEAQAASSPGPR